MLNNSTSIENLTKRYEFEHKKAAYYRMVRDSAKRHIDEDNMPSYWRDQSRVERAYERAVNSLEYVERRIKGVDDFYKVNGKHIERLCSLKFDNDRTAEYNLEELIKEFDRMLFLADSKEPIWKTLTEDGIKPSDEDEEWYELLFKREANPEHSLSYKVSQIDKPHKDLERLISTCTILEEDLSTRVRFTYADSPDEPMANTYIFYWMYGEGELKDKLATSESDLAFFNATKSMLPLGIGVTDENGYLVQSAQMADYTKVFQEIDLENGTFEVKPGTIYGGWTEKDLIKDNDFNKLKERGQAFNVKDVRSAYVDDSWNEWLNTRYFERVLADYNTIEKLGPKNRNAPELTAPSRILHSYVSKGYFIDNNAETIDGLSIHETEQFNHISSHYFSVEREYGFFAYPVNRGSFKTKNLLSLAEGDEPVARKGIVPFAKDENGQPEPIKLHCTLPEWDRRITKKLDTLNLELTKAADKVKMHTQNIERLSGMNNLVSLQMRYPSESRTDEQIEVGNELMGKISQLSEAIKDELEGDKDDSLFISTKDLESVDEAAEALMKLLFSEAFLTELNSYLKSAMSEEDNKPPVDEAGHIKAGPYMESEPYWAHIIDTLQQCMTALGKTHFSDEIWTKWVEPALEDFSNQDDVIKLVQKYGKELSEFHGYGKVIHGYENRSEVPVPPEVQEYGENLATLLSKVDQTIQDEELARLEKEALELEHWNPIAWILSCYKKIADPVLHRTPGPASIIQQAIDIYSDRITAKMKKKGTLFEFKFNVALFHLCGVHKLNGEKLPVSLFNKMAFTGYVAQSPKEDQVQYIKRLRVVKGVRSEKIDEQIREVIELMMPEQDSDKKDVKKESLSDRIYNTQKYNWYKTLMFSTTTAIHAHTLSTLSDAWNSKDEIEQSLFILEAAGDLIYYSVLSSRLLASWKNVKISVGTEIVGEAASRYLAAIAVLQATYIAYQHFKKGDSGEGAFQVAMAMNMTQVQVAYALQQSFGRNFVSSLTQKTVARSGAVRVLTIGLSAIGAALVGPVGLIVGSFIGAVFTAYELAKAIEDGSRTSLDHMFQSYQDKISESEVPRLSMQCHELYSSELPIEARELFDDIKELGYHMTLGVQWAADLDKGFDFDKLNWRAVVPLYLQGFKVELIKSLVDFSKSTTESTRMYGRNDSKQVRLTVNNAEDIITYFKHMRESENETMPSGRSKKEIATELAEGTFIPVEGMADELTINEDGKERILSFDHLYFREPLSEKGICWEDLNKKSHEIYNENYLP